MHANVAWLTDQLATTLPGLVTALPLDATYLVWLDCTGLVARLGLGAAGALATFFVDEARLCLSPGPEFDPDGAADGCMRLNAACPRAMLEDAVRRLQLAVQRRAAAAPNR